MERGGRGRVGDGKGTCMDRRERDGRGGEGERRGREGEGREGKGLVQL